jgi:predicted HicB family RNase H-like nuclease
LGGRPNRGNPRFHLRLDPRILAGLEIVARRHGLTVNQVIYVMIEGYLARVGGWRHNVL